MDPITQQLFKSTGVNYTDAVWFQGAVTNSTAQGLGVLQLHNNSPTETAWEVPGGVTSISVAVMGSGGGGQNLSNLANTTSFACGGGELVWRNGISVTPGQTLYVHCGSAGDSGVAGSSGIGSKYVSDTSYNETAWTDSAVANYVRASYIRAWVSGSNKFVVYAEGGLNKKNDDTGGGNDAGGRMNAYTYGTLGTEDTDWRHSPGGTGGGRSTQGSNYQAWSRGSGGGGGWTGAGGNGGANNSGQGGGGSGGGSGGGASSNSISGSYGHGGHTFMWGSGDSGSGGGWPNGLGGAGSKTGTGASTTPPDGVGQGGGGARDGWVGPNAMAPLYPGWVRIVWSTSGQTRNFPSTNVGYPG
jgi:hypothetical protein